MQHDMRVLFLCNKSPYPPKEGGPIAMNALIEGLADKGHLVKVLAVSSEKYPVKEAEIPDEYLKKTSLESVFLDLRIKPMNALYNMFLGRSYHVSRFVSANFSDRLVSILQEQEFDIIQLETLFMCPYIRIIRKHSKARIILRAHNIEHVIWQQLALQEKKFWKKYYLNHLYKVLKSYELHAMALVDGIAAITYNDAEFIRAAGIRVPVEAVNFAVPGLIYEVSVQPRPLPSVFHVGSMNWLPNEEGMKWFLDEVWPQVNKAYPDLPLYLAGRFIPSWLKNGKYNKVIIMGEVSDAIAFMKEHEIMVVPLFSGSGVRIKIIEAMSAGKAVISTHKGAEGIRCTDHHEILFAESAEDFRNCIALCLNNPNLVKSLGENAKKLILQEHNTTIILDKLEQFYQHLIAESKTDAA
jgi:polysaccharide biosynthesis protein PslH